MTEDNQRALLARYSIVTQNTILMMKSSHILSLLAPLALLLPAQAQDCDQDSCDGQERAQRTSTQSVQDPAPKPKRRQGTDRDAIKKRLLKKYDANGDGELDRKELAKARKDGALPGVGQRGKEPEGGEPQPDGKRPEREAIRKRILKKYDANGDGELSREEMAQARKDGALPGRGQGEKPQEGETKKPKEGEGETPKKRKGKRGKIG